jgi:hypothetical protein
LYIHDYSPLSRGGGGGGLGSGFGGAGVSAIFDSFLFLHIGRALGAYGEWVREMFGFDGEDFYGAMSTWGAVAVWQLATRTHFKRGGYRERWD